VALRIILDGRQPAFTLKLERCCLDARIRSPQAAQVAVAQGLHYDRATPLDIVIQQERLRLEFPWLGSAASAMTGFVMSS